MTENLNLDIKLKHRFLRIIFKLSADGNTRETSAREIIFHIA